MILVLPWPQPSEGRAGYRTSLSTYEEEIRQLDCDPRAIAKSMLELEVVPSVLYHFGEREKIMEDITARSVPQRVWNEVLMRMMDGIKGRYQLMPYRYGLYGSSGIDANTFGIDDKYSWLMEIHIKPECRKVNDVASILFLGENPHFLAWWLKTKDLPFSSIEEFTKTCYGNDAMPRKDFAPAFGESCRPNSPCETVFERYIIENNFKIILDHAYSRSFYIRDRRCIETILGTPEELAHILSEKKILWISECGSSNSITIPNLILKILTSTSNLPTSETGQLSANIASLSDLDEESRELIKESLAAYERCISNGLWEVYRSVAYQRLPLITPPGAAEAIRSLCPNANARSVPQSMD